MLKFTINIQKGPVIYFGLSAMNIQKLQEGKPIRINLEDLGLKGEVYIFAGDTEASMLDDLKAAGLIPPSFMSAEPKASTDATRERYEAAFADGLSEILLQEQLDKHGGDKHTVQGIVDVLSKLSLEELKAVLMYLKVGKAWGRDD